MLSSVVVGYFDQFEDLWAGGSADCGCSDKNHYYCHVYVALSKY